MFGVKPVTDQALDRKRKFLIKLVDCCDNAVCLARAKLDSLNWLCSNCLLIILSACCLFVLFVFI